MIVASIVKTVMYSTHVARFLEQNSSFFVCKLPHSIGQLSILVCPLEDRVVCQIFSLRTRIWLTVGDGADMGRESAGTGTLEHFGTSRRMDAKI